MKNTKPNTSSNIPLINNNIKTVIKRLESDTKKMIILFKIKILIMMIIIIIILIKKRKNAVI